MEWMTTWETGAQVHIHLPTEMSFQGKRLKIVWPPACPITLVKVWNTCILPVQSSITDATMMFERVSWQNNLDFIGMTFEFKSDAYYRSCIKTKDFRFKIINISKKNFFRLAFY